ncbi:MAG: MBL fold metallo-hydrolase [Chloroflexi bacterium]|nr:MBL fold metallo-hydrolase [Chloroflexota bacterium]
MPYQPVVIQPDVVRFTVEFPDDPRRHVHSFLLFAGDEALLIDASWDTPEGHAALEAALATRGLGPEAVRTVLITHLHADHVGLAARLQRLGARILYHPGDEITMRSIYQHVEEFRGHTRVWEELNGGPPDLGLIMSRSPLISEKLKAVPEPDQRLRGGEVIAHGPFRLRPVWTPGHTLGHLCYYEQTNRWLFTGDHVLPKISPHVGLYVHATGNPLLSYMDSLRLLNDYDVSLAIPAHGDPFPDLHHRLDELTAHHHERLTELEAVAGHGPATAWEIAGRAHWTHRKVSLRDLSPWHWRLALAETIAHLELLRAQGRITKRFVPGLVQYGPVEGVSRG